MVVIAAVREDRSEEVIAILDVTSITSDSTQVVGREVSVRDVRVTAVTPHGFRVARGAQSNAVFVFSAEGELVRVHQGDLVDIHGEVRAARRSSSSGQPAQTAAGIELYIYAYTVRPAY